MRMERVLYFLAKLLSKKGIIAFEAGDLRRGGRTYFITDDVTSRDAIKSLQLSKEVRFINTFKVAIRDPQGYNRWLSAEKGSPDDAPIELNHEYITILRNLRGVRGNA